MTPKLSHKKTVKSLEILTLHFFAKSKIIEMKPFEITLPFQGIVSTLLFLCTVEYCNKCLYANPQCSFSFRQLILEIGIVIKPRSDLQVYENPTEFGRGFGFAKRPITKCIMFQTYISTTILQ